MLSNLVDNVVMHAANARAAADSGALSKVFMLINTSVFINGISRDRFGTRFIDMLSLGTPPTCFIFPTRNKLNNERAASLRSKLIKCTARK